MPVEYPSMRFGSRYSIRTSVFVAWLGLFAASGHSAVYYVATNGTDGGQGTFAQPWRTIQYAAGVLTNGDTLLVRGGTYTNAARIIPANSGSAGNYITYTRFSNETVVIDGTVRRKASRPGY